MLGGGDKKSRDRRKTVKPSMRTFTLFDYTFASWRAHHSSSEEESHDTVEQLHLGISGFGAAGSSAAKSKRAREDISGFRQDH
jgi:hypothetical protein